VGTLSELDEGDRTESPVLLYFGLPPLDSLQGKRQSGALSEQCCRACTSYELDQWYNDSTLCCTGCHPQA